MPNAFFANRNAVHTKNFEAGLETLISNNPTCLYGKNAEIALNGKTIMVTGAGGSIGSELCRQISAKKPKLLLLIDNCESLLFETQQSLAECETLQTIIPFVADICNTCQMRAIIQKYRPQIIFHTAALKHVPLSETQPVQAMKTNALGTFNLAKIASENGAEKFIFVSTDKAVNPSGVMGATKRLAETAVGAIQSLPENKTVFSCVRFGNVLGSSGSVLKTFNRQLKNGGPITITDPNITRYFMTISQAVGLVLECASFAEPNKTFILNMGAPVKIIDLAKKFIAKNNATGKIQIKVTGLRRGEKLCEELAYKNEICQKTENERILAFSCKAAAYSEICQIMQKIEHLSYNTDTNSAKRALAEFVREYTPQFYD